MFFCQDNGTEKCIEKWQCEGLTYALADLLDKAYLTVLFDSMFFCPTIPSIVHKIIIFFYKIVQSPFCINGFNFLIVKSK